MKIEKYYLSSMDSINFSETRECVFLKKLSFSTGKECILVKLDPPVIGQQFGLGGEDLECVFLASRHEGEPIDPISSFPCFVYVARPLVSGLANRGIIDKADLEIIAWAEIYGTRHDADNHIFNSQDL